jgi:sulfite exporter TauE/SafE
VTAALALTVLAASLLGSLHCAGMCGPLVALYAGADAAPRAARLGHAAYNLGRLVAYALLGAAAGLAGALLDLGGRLAGIQSAAAIVGGLTLAAFGLHALAAALHLRVPRLEAPRVLRAAAARAAAGLHATSIPKRAAALGLLSGLLPCGWLWAFLATAAGTGAALHGAALMAVFWVGTLPALIALGAAARAAAGPLRRHLPAACAAIVVAMGLFLALARGGHAPLDPLRAGVPLEPPCHAGR